jgi:putative hydrolase of the HAD superfamily
MARPIKTVSFDLWDTVFIDDSDEPKRAAAGLPTKAVQRRILMHQFLERHGAVSRELVDRCYDTADAAFREVWYGQNVTWPVRVRLGVLLQGLGRKLPEIEFAELVRLHEEMELEYKPDLLPHIGEALESLKGKYKLAVISDAIFSPGRALRELLKHYGLLHYFDYFVFSDEVGYSKPDPRAFHAVAKNTGCALEEIVHLGDREAKDIDGPHAVGARGVLVPIAKDRGGLNSKADAVCRDYRELAAILRKLEA